MATIQDEGRFGHRQYGIPYSGAMDRMSLHHANELVGNPPMYPAIEITLQGIEVEAMETTVVGLCGAEGTDNVVPLSMMRSRNFAKDYGVLIEDGPLAGITARAIVVLDENDKVVYTELVPEIAQEPDYDAALAALA